MTRMVIRVRVGGAAKEEVYREWGGLGEGVWTAL